MYRVFLKKRVPAFVFFCFILALSSGSFAENGEEKTSAPAPAAEGSAEEDIEAKKEIEAIKKEAEEAKAEAEAARIEKEEAKKQEEALKKAIEIEKAKLELDQKESALTEQEAEIVKKTSKDKAEIKTAAERSKQEKQEDIEAKERIKLAEERMLASQKKAQLAEEEMKLAQERMTLAMERLRIKEGRPDILVRLIESVIVLVSGLFLIFLLKLGVKRLEKVLTKQDVIRESEATLQIKTVAKLLNWLGTIAIMVIILYIVLEKHGLDMAPLLAGAGIMGLAFGFGGQYLIRDLINGLFILIEGQYRVNDVVKIGEYGGLVEDINLRITTLRDLEGRVIIVPNGEIKTVVNFTREYSQALLDVGVAYKEDVDKVMEVIKDMGKEMRQDAYFKRLILGDLEMLGVDDFSSSAVMIKFRIKTLPIKQWEVMREFRRRLKNKFDELGIEIPFPHTTVYWGTGKDNDWMRNAASGLPR
ncbi:MAG: mechanosensitive ion channel domain-containing protein [Candidatus Omnitrophota bacterium]